MRTPRTPRLVDAAALAAVALSAIATAGCGGGGSEATRSTTSSSTTVVLGIPVDDGAGDATTTTSSTTSTTTTTAPETGRDPAAGGCPVGEWRMQDLPTGLPYTIESGGTGTLMTIDRDGVVTQDFSDFEPQWASSTSDPTMRTYYAPTGSMTGHIDLAGADRNWMVSDVDASGLGGEGRTEIDGQVVMEFSDLGQLAASLGGMQGAVIACEGDGTLSIGVPGTPIAHHYRPAAE